MPDKVLEPDNDEQPLNRCSPQPTDWDTIDWTYENEAHTQFVVQRREKNTSHSGAVSQYVYKVTEHIMSWCSVLLIGCLTGVIAGAVDFSSALLSGWRVGYCSDIWWLSRDTCCPMPEETCDKWVTWQQAFQESIPMVDFLSFFTTSVFYGLLCAWLVTTFAPYAAGSGIPEIKTILSGIRINRYLGGWTLLIKCTGLALSVGAGLSLGKEGPFVHVATCVGNLVTNFIPKYKYHESKRREILSASCAAGVAVAFAAPIGGVLFSLEEASYYFPHKTMWHAFFCAVAAALTLKSIDPTSSGSLVMFKLDYDHPWHWFELIPHAMLGVIGGIVGAVFNSLNVKWIRYKRSGPIKNSPLLEVFIVTAITALFNYNVGFLKPSATDFLKQLFKQCPANSDEELCQFNNPDLQVNLFLAGVLKFALTVFTFGIKVPAGIFIPSLYSGACFGRLIGTWVKRIQYEHSKSYLFSECSGTPESLCVIPGIYAIVGAASVLGGVTRMTLSLAVIVFELTGGLEYLVPVMLAVIISKWVGEWVGGKLSIYETHIIMNGYPYLDPKIEVNNGDTVRKLLPDQNLHVIPSEGMRVGELAALLRDDTFKGFPVVSKENSKRIVGWALRKNLLCVLAMAKKMDTVSNATGIVFSGNTKNRTCGDLLDASWFIDSTPMQISPETSVNRLLQLFKSLGLRSILVTHQAELVGILTRKDVLEYVAQVCEDYDEELQSPPPQEVSNQSFG